MHHGAFAACGGSTLHGEAQLSGVFRKRRTAFPKKLHRAVFACVCGAGFHFDFIRCIALFDFANLDFKAKEAEMNEHGLILRAVSRVHARAETEFCKYAGFLSARCFGFPALLGG